MAAADFTVNTTADTPPSGGCTTNFGGCTLREAITAANANANKDVITIPAGTYAVNPNIDGSLTSTLPSISTTMDLNGAGAATTIVDAGGNQPEVKHILQVQQEAAAITVNINDLTLQNNLGADGGPVRIAFNFASTANLNRVVVRNNANTSGNSGGIFATGNAGTVNLVDSTVAANTTGGNGGGAVEQAGPVSLNVDRSTITGNQGGDCSAICVNAVGATPSAPVTVRNSTISGNTSGGGLIVDYNTSATTSLSYNTITNNTPAAFNAVFRRNGSSGVTFKGNIFSGNHLSGAGAANCSFGGATPPTSQGFNFDSGAGCKFTNAAAGDRQNTTVALGPLANNGGFTFTHALPAGSAAIDAGGAGGCTVIGGAALTVDQRGVTRPQGPACDSGAFEAAAASGATTTPTTGGGGGAGGSGAGGGPVGGGGGGGTLDVTAPVFASASASPPTFAVDRRGRVEAPVAARVRKGTTFRYRLSEAARVVFTIQRARPGRKVRGRCVKPTRRNRTARRCTRYTRVGRFARASRAGLNSHKFSGRIGRRSLSPGVYRAILVATDASGNRSARKTLRLRVVRR